MSTAHTAHDRSENRYRRFDVASTDLIAIPPVRAPACPINDGATWRQVILTVATLITFIALTITGLSRRPLPVLGTALAAAGVLTFAWVTYTTVASKLRVQRR